MPNLLAVEFEEEAFEEIPVETPKKGFINFLKKARPFIHQLIDCSVPSLQILATVGKILHFIKEAASILMALTTSIAGVGNLLCMNMTELYHTFNGEIKRHLAERRVASVASIALGAFAVPVILGVLLANFTWIVPMVFVAIGIVQQIKEFRIGNKIQAELKQKKREHRELSQELSADILVNADVFRDKITCAASPTYLQLEKSAKTYYEQRKEIKKLGVEAKATTQKKYALTALIATGVLLALTPVCPVLGILGLCTLLGFGIAVHEIGRREKQELKAIDEQPLPEKPLEKFIEERSLTESVLKIQVKNPIVAPEPVEEQKPAIPDELQKEIDRLEIQEQNTKKMLEADRVQVKKEISKLAKTEVSISALRSQSICSYRDKTFPTAWNSSPAMSLVKK
jgi:hypothetical protein